MKLRDQCCTREQGARLVQLGVKPESCQQGPEDMERVKQILKQHDHYPVPGI